jgi:FlaA1/EpsC-like NDP-sugar epimerase
MQRSAKKTLIATVDATLCAALLVLSAWLHEVSVSPQVIGSAVVFAAVSVVMLTLLRAYREILSHIEPESLLRVMISCVLGGVAVALISPRIGSTLGVDSIAFAVSAAFCALAVLRIVGRRAIREHAAKHLTPRTIGIYGAGAAGLQVAAALKRSVEYRPVVFFDDDSTLQGRTLSGLPVRSTRELPSDLARFGIEEILLAIPSVDRATRRKILESLQSLPVRIKTIPGINDIVTRRLPIDQVSDIGVEDLLGRETVSSGEVDVASAIAGKSILVTGAGGSIGSELCRQIFLHKPARIVCLDLSEAALYSIHHSLTTAAANADAPVVVPVLGNVRDGALLKTVLREHRIDSVYHAAAYKHVPLVESNPFEALLNNTFGTLALVDAALEAGVRFFLFVSTDKAVRPTNVMGASKRLAELIIQARSAAASSAAHKQTKLCIVRFGNVLDSSGSVVPLFRRQVLAGGPVTVTHPEVTRYFMTIPEAVQLVLQAGVLADSGDVCVLDMGEPVRIVDVARKVIRLSGFSVRDDTAPEGDIRIEFIGLRPGEKLHEELLIGTDVFQTEHPKVMRAREEVIPWPELAGILDGLRDAILRRDARDAVAWLRRSVRGYQTSGFLTTQNEAPNRSIESPDTRAVGPAPP